MLPHEIVRPITLAFLDARIVALRACPPHIWQRPAGVRCAPCRAGIARAMARRAVANARRDSGPRGHWPARGELADNARRTPSTFSVLGYAQTPKGSVQTLKSPTADGETSRAHNTNCRAVRHLAPTNAQSSPHQPDLHAWTQPVGRIGIATGLWGPAIVRHAGKLGALRPTLVGGADPAEAPLK
jgi:hypothetical protein